MVAEQQEDEPWPEDVPIPLEHPLVPDAIREASSPYIQQGCVLHRAPCSRSVEWWLLDDHGELVEAMWEEVERQARR